MHAVIAHFAPLLAAEKSKTPFYVAGGLLVAWALIVSLGLGLRIANFPRTAVAERAVMGISAMLVVLTVSMAVVTSGGEAGKATAAPAAQEGREAASGSATSSLQEAADPEGQLRFTAKRLTATAGRVTISFANASSLEHNLTVAQGATVVGATPTFQGGTKTLTLNLKPGTYTLYCSVPGHRQAGMEGKLSVR
ncbi:MAG TPA: plastocyanin/azurin family copper-binding protein [Solirubrobacteraceae bacterium]|nr:plastocyanin/azurin family copper-binding protein [Solirubrobacteraceae bacterium]